MVINGKILCLVNDIPIIKPEYRYTEDCYTGVLPHTFYYNFCWANEYGSLYRNIVVPKIIKPVFHWIYFINFTLLKLKSILTEIKN